MSQTCQLSQPSTLISFQTLNGLMTYCCATVEFPSLCMYFIDDLVDTHGRSSWHIKAYNYYEKSVALNGVCMYITF